MTEPSQIENTVDFLEENETAGKWPENSTVWVTTKTLKNKNCKIIMGDNFTESRIVYLWVAKSNNNHFFKNISSRRASYWDTQLRAVRQICITYKPNPMLPRLPYWFLKTTHNFMMEISLNVSKKSWELINLYPEEIKTNPDHIMQHIMELDYVLGLQSEE